MRLVVGLLALTLSGSLALADEANAPEPQPEPAPVAHVAPKAKAGLRVVRILPESNQALLFDKNRGTHVLAEVGSTIGGYTVDAIDEDEVTLSANGKELVLTAPDGTVATKRSSLREEKAAPAKKIEAPADPYGAEGEIVDPYADATDAASAPLDPYAEPKVREVSAPTPIVAGEGGIRVSSHKADPSWMSPEPAFVPPGAPTTAKPLAETPTDPYGAEEPAPAPVITPTVLSRSELNVALADFGKLTNLVRGSFTAQGARLDMVAEGSLFAKAGLKTGDVITAVDNAPLRTIDDAADLYVRASATKAANISLLRAGKPLTLRVLIH